MFSMVSPSSINSKCLKRDYSYFRTNFSVRQLLVCTRFSYFFVYIIDSDRHPRNICKTAEMLGFSARVLNTFEPQKTP